MKRKGSVLLLILSALLLSLAAVRSHSGAKTYGVMQDLKFDAVFLDTSIEDFTAAGFQFGDSCDVRFSNGLTLEDIPFFSGYYVRVGEPVIVGYPGNEHVLVTRNNQGLWTDSGITDSDTAVVTLHEAGKYLSVQTVLNQSYTLDRADYDSDVQFSNFRALKGGALKEDFVYRGASPVDNEKNRAAITDALLCENGIRFILDLADTKEDFLGYENESGFASPFAAGLYDSGKVALLGLNANFASDEFREKLAAGLREMTAAEGPVYIHCLEGKDRTGFVCCLLEALAGASYEEMAADYMMTYANYYGITKDESGEKYDAVLSLYFDAFASYLHGTEDAEILRGADYTGDAEQYLLDGGMTPEEIDALRAMITGD